MKILYTMADEINTRVKYFLHISDSSFESQAIRIFLTDPYHLAYYLVHRNDRNETFVKCAAPFMF